MQPSFLRSVYRQFPVQSVLSVLPLDFVGLAGRLYGPIPVAQPVQRSNQNRSTRVEIAVASCGPVVGSGCGPVFAGTMQEIGPAVRIDFVGLAPRVDRKDRFLAHRERVVVAEKKWTIWRQVS